MRNGKVLTDQGDSGRSVRLRFFGLMAALPADCGANIWAFPSRSRKSADNDTPSVVATLAMFWKLKLLSPRSIVPMKVRWTPHLSAKPSCE